MKTKDQINSAISAIQTEHKNPIMFSDRELNAARKKIAIMRKCVYYLETDPRREFIVQQLEESNKKISILNKRFEDWKQLQPKEKLDKLKNPKTFYYKEIAPGEEKEIKEVKFQIETLNYLLS